MSTIIYNILFIISAIFLKKMTYGLASCFQDKLTDKRSDLFANPFNYYLDSCFIKPKNESTHLG